MQIEQYKKYLVRVNIRPEYKGRAIKPNLESLQGQEIEVQTMWLQDGDDPYPGEYALKVPIYIMDKYEMSWIASGDVEVLIEIKRGEG